MFKLFVALRNHARHQEIIFFMLLVAFAVLKFPLQKYIPLARFQHYGISLYLWSVGFIMQSIWSWTKLKTMGKITLVVTGTYLSIFAFVLYSNPWLDTNISIQTSNQIVSFDQYKIFCCVGGLILSVLWVCWGIEEYKDSRHNK